MIRINLLKPESKDFREGPAFPGPEIKAKKALKFRIAKAAKDAAL
jgi:hypothetical protein